MIGICGIVLTMILLTILSFDYINNIVFFRSSASQQIQRLHSSRCCDFSLSFPYPSSIIQYMSFCLGLPLPYLPSILPSIISFSIESPLRMCPIQFFCLVNNINNALWSYALYG